MTGRLITPGEEWLDSRFHGDIPDDLDGMELTQHLLEAADEWLDAKGYDQDSFGAFPKTEQDPASVLPKVKWRPSPANKCVTCGETRRDIRVERISCSRPDEMSGATIIVPRHRYQPLS